ncbi:hypothetical protein [Saccharospirillum impatiens]|uniref:hypothetical protein n=1 Tax=Saccharospirillum impatiens TaxID=169438 RepID=UPI0012FC21C2|nr:hypothetical protein [Saccharospirillum impatiens]
MNTEKSLIDAYNSKSIGSGREPIILKPYCLEFISDCRISGLAILGIEGYFVANGKVCPNINEIADFSNLPIENWETYLKESIEAANRFIGIMMSSGKSDAYGFALTNEFIEISK